MRTENFTEALDYLDRALKIVPEDFNSLAWKG
jgi:hypothetical protein